MPFFKQFFFFDAILNLFLPGSRHAGEIASLSMDLIEGIRMIKLAHLPNERLRMRVGLHTGKQFAFAFKGCLIKLCVSQK